MQQNVWDSAVIGQLRQQLYFRDVQHSHFLHDRRLGRRGAHGGSLVGMDIADTAAIYRYTVLYQNTHTYIYFIYGKYLIYHKKVLLFLIYHNFFWSISHIPQLWYMRYSSNSKCST
jgi:hypothetical protein